MSSDKDDDLRTKGQVINNMPDNHRAWFRKDDTKRCSGHFENGEQAGEWTACDKNGKVYKITAMRLKAR